MRRPPKKRTFHEFGQSLTLLDRGTHVELVIGDVPILTSATLGTERDFGRLASMLATRPDPRILVGGLGFGATARAVCDCVSEYAQVIVVERMSTVVKLVRGELAHVAGNVLDDPRLKLVRADVVDVIATERDLDVILLDVDNGPEWASFRDNARLYDRVGLRAGWNALRDGGAYAVWSGYPVDEFLGELQAAGFAAHAVDFVENERVQARAYVGVKKV